MEIIIMSHYDWPVCGTYGCTSCTREPAHKKVLLHNIPDEVQATGRREDAIKVPLAVKSDGGSSSYYQLRLLVQSSKIKDLEGHDEVKVVELETGDIIRALVDNDFDLGNIIKACRRIHQAKKGTGKSGTNVEYDCKKIDYFLKEWYKAYQMEQLWKQVLSLD